MGNKPTLQIIGCFASEYSLAKLNRNLAITLSATQDKFDVSLWGNAEILDRLPTNADFQRYPQLKQLFNPVKRHTDIAIYNNFPKSLSTAYGTEVMAADLKFGYLAWEESIFPAKWVTEINKNLHAMFVTSDHTGQVLRKSGVAVPIINVGAGVDHYPANSKEVYKVNSLKKFKFLHVSSGHYRKGVDVLIKAYVNAFTSNDDVSLILKVFTNPNSEVDMVLEEVRKIKSPAEMPEIIVINNPDLTDGEMQSLFQQCDAVVLPTRAEGFGMPMAEAFEFNKPLITTGYSGQMDFCNYNNSLLLDYTIVESKSHLGIPGSMVAEPDQKDLEKKMQFLINNAQSNEVQKMLDNATESAKAITWQNTANKIATAIEQLTPTLTLKNKNLAVLSTINNKCGVAIYAKEFYFPIRSSFNDFRIFSNTDIADRVCDDQNFVSRTWKYGESDWETTLTALRDFKPDYLHIQFNFSDYEVAMLGKLVSAAKAMNTKVLVTLHSVDESLLAIVSDLNSANQVYIHSDNDLELLRRIGVTNAVKFLYGINKYNDLSKEVIRANLNLKQAPIIASHGLIHDKKGLCELLEAVNILKQDYPQMLYLAVDAINQNNITSTATYNKMLELIAEHNLAENVILITDFIKDIEVLRLLQAADLIVLPYAELNEGASGAIRASFAAHRPVIITNSYIFSNIIDAGFRIVDNKPETIAQAVKTLLSDNVTYNSELAKIEKYMEANSWLKSVEQYFEVLSRF